ncbi:flagellar hook-length control protein FliK [Pseudomonas nitritireducens]|uniref:Flagellar hook-length control protein FliK n=1 Tax=Pseudomonas nitroreducens TaxID=46680 RepID=A0A7W7KFW1_PSENT|nr:flagellar hook-length control protein FliK [Pseudomonas nitritireducens]MBB4862046.1 flagellar hook-length control protein FliK [Pseudomonas nitritireducens]
MIQLPTQSLPNTDRGAPAVAEARPQQPAHDDAAVAGFRARDEQPGAAERRLTVQSFLAQFDTAQVEHSLPPSDAALPVLPEALPAETRDNEVQEPAGEPSPSGAENWLAGMLSQAGLVVQARYNPPAQTRAQVAGFATQAADASVQPAPAAVKPEDLLLPPAELSEEPAKSTTPAPREATQSQAQTLLQQHLAATAQAPDSTVPTQPTVALDARLPATDGNAQPAIATPPVSPLFDRPLHLKGNNEAHWGEQMLGALRDNVDLQISQRVQNATIRLDPPELGALEILVRHEAGQLNVQISASNGDVVRLLQNTSERLRQDLVGQNFLQVNVQVSPDSQSGQPGQQQRQRFTDEQAVVDANPRDAQSGQRSAPRGDSDVLITV